MRATVWVLALAVMGCLPARWSRGGGDAQEPLPRYPVWFVNPGGGSSGAAGFAPRYQTLVESESLAERGARARYRAYRAMRVRADGAFIAGDGQGIELVGERVLIDTLADGGERGVVQFARVGSMVIARLGAAAPRDSSWMDMPTRAPSWLTQLPTDQSWFTAVGVSAVSVREEYAWEAAEDHAIRQLASSVALRIKGLAGAGAGVERMVIDANSDVELRDVQVMARWRDRDRCAVLMRARGRPTAESS